MSTPRVDSRRYTLAERKEILAAMPWVTPLKKPVPCQGIKWGTVALKDIWAMGPRDNPRPARGIQPRSRCKKLAHWRFRKARRSTAYSGRYCWHHLMAQLYADRYEEERVRKWDEEFGWLWDKGLSS